MDIKNMKYIVVVFKIIIYLVFSINMFEYIIFKSLYRQNKKVKREYIVLMTR